MEIFGYDLMDNLILTSAILGLGLGFLIFTFITRRMLPLTLRRMRQDWRVLLVLLFAISLVTAFLALGPLYIRGVTEVDLRYTLDNAEDTQLKINIISDQPLGPDQQAIVEEELGGLVTDIERYKRADYTAPELGAGQAPGLIAISTCGFLFQLGQDPALGAGSTQHCYQPFAFDNLAERVDVVSGRLPQRTPPPEEISGAGMTLEEQELGEVGWFNRGQVEAVVTTAVAEEADVELGTRFLMGNIFLDGTVTVTSVKIVGVVEVKDPEDSFWDGNTMFVEGATIDLDNFGNTQFDFGLAFDPASYDEWVAPVVPGTSYIWRMDTDPSIINADNADTVTAGLNNIRNQLRANDPTSQVVSGYGSLLAGYGGRVESAEGPITFLSGAVLVLLLYHLMTTVSLVLQQQGKEWSTITSRGGSTLQLFSMQFFTVTILAIISFGLAFLLSRVFMLFMQEFGPLSDVLGNASLTSVPTPRRSVTLALGGAVAAAIALSIPSIPAAATSLLRLKQGASRPPTVPTWTRFSLDMVFIGGGLLFIGRMYVNAMEPIDFFDKLREAWRLLVREPENAIDTIARNIGETNGLNDPLNLLGMGLFVTGMALLWLRIFPLLVGLISNFTSRVRNLTTPLAVWNVERDPGHYAQLVLLLIGTLALGTASLGLTETRDVGAWQTAQDQVGGSVRVDLEPSANLSGRVAWERLDGVEDYAVLLNTTVLPVRESVSGVDIEVIGVDAEAFADTFPQYASEVAALEGAPQLNIPGITLDEDAARLEVQVWSTSIAEADLPDASVALNAYLMDAAGVPYVVRLERPSVDVGAGAAATGQDDNAPVLRPPTPPDQWVTLTGALPPTGRKPYSLWQIGIATRQGEVSSFSHIIYLDFLQTVTESGVARELETFELIEDVWEPASTSDAYVVTGSDNTVFESTVSGVEMAFVDINQEGLESFLPDNETVLKLDYTVRNVLAETSEPAIAINPVMVDRIPVIISKAFASTFKGTGQSATRGRTPNLRVGDTRAMQLNVGPGTVPVAMEIVDVIDFFPTIVDRNSDDNTLFIIMPLNTARLWFNQAAHPRAFFDANEVWLDLPEREPSSALQQDLESLEGVRNISYGWDRYGQILREPLPSAIAGMLFAGFWISLALSLLDFAFYLVVTAQQRSFTFGVLRSLGWNANNIWRLLLVEQATLVTPALLIGSILGVVLAYLILPFLSLVGNESLRIPLIGLSGLIASLVISFAILLVVAAVYLRRMSVNQVLRLGEE